MLNSLNLHKSLHENDRHSLAPDFGSLKCYKVNSSFNFKTYSGRSPQKGKAKVSKEQETLKKTLDLYELQAGDQNKTLLLLGQAIKSGNKSKSSRFHNWLQRLFGPDCVKVVSGTEIDLEVNQKLGAVEKGTIAVETNGEKITPS